MEYVQTFDSGFEKFMGQYMKKPTIIRGIIHLLLMLYAARIAPQMPPAVIALFDNQYFKLFVFSLILWTAQFSPSTSLLIALSFMLTVNYANNKPLWEFMDNTDGVAQSKDEAIQSAQSSIESQAADTQVVASVTPTDSAVLVQPQIVPANDGSNTIINPSIVVAPAVVSAPNGETIVITPEVTVVQPTAAPAAAELAPAPAAAELAPAPAAVEIAPAAAPVPAAEGCFPVRKYNMDEVSPYSPDAEYGSV